MYSFSLSRVFLSCKKYENLTEKKKYKNVLIFAYFPCGKLTALETNFITDAIAFRKGFGLIILAMFEVISTGKKVLFYLPFLSQNAMFANL